jgi:hypothetical protein
MLPIDYDHDEDGVYSYVPWEDRDFRSMLYLWASVHPYSEFKSASTKRLLLAFENDKAIIFKRGINTIGLAIWGWMNSEEHGRDEYDPEEIFLRDDGEMLILIDLIMPNNGKIAIKHLRAFGSKVLPHQKRVFFNRPNRKSSLRINE